MIEKITSTLEFDRKKHFKFFENFENHRILDFKQLNLIEKITSNFEKFEKSEVLMGTLLSRVNILILLLEAIEVDTLKTVFLHEPN